MAAPAAQWVKSSTQLELVGQVDFDNVVSLLRDGESWIRQASGDSCLLSLGGLTYSNSAAVALILGLRRQAEKDRKNLNIAHVPDNLISMMRLGGLDWLLDANSLN
jgi:phospholipid transport system transporter-binding protein